MSAEELEEQSKVLQHNLRDWSFDFTKVDERTELACVLRMFNDFDLPATFKISQQ